MQFWQKYKSDFIINLSLALPIMGGQLGQILVNLADNLMVGRLGAAPLAAIALANALFIIFMVIGMGLSFALPPLVSESDGAGQGKRISQYFKHSLVVNFIYSLLALTFILLANPILHHIGQEVEVVNQAIPYLKISAWTLIPFMLFQTIRCYCDGLSDTLSPMVAIIIGNIVNIFFNYGFIFGKMGLPDLGVKGAALASLIARVVMVLVILFLVFRKSKLMMHLEHIDFKRFQRNMFRKVLALGIPTSAQLFFEVTAFSGAAIIMGLLGKNPQAAHQISINMASITFLVCTGIGMAASIRVGNQLGKRSRSGLRNAGFSAIIQVVAFMSFTALFFVVLRNSLPYLYISDPVVVEIAAFLLIMAAIFQIPDGVQVTALSALRGLQDVRTPTMITFISYWVFGIPISYLTAIKFGLGPGGVWLGLIIGLTASSILLTYRFHQISKRIFL